jgi:hypothetical protein
MQDKEPMVKICMLGTLIHPISKLGIETDFVLSRKIAYVFLETARATKPQFVDKHDLPKGNQNRIE